MDGASAQVTLFKYILFLVMEALVVSRQACHSKFAERILLWRPASMAPVTSVSERW